MNKLKNILTISFLIIAILSLVTITYSWFYNNYVVSMSNEGSANLISTPFLDISADGTNWNNPFPTDKRTGQSYYNTWNHVTYAVNQTISDVSSDGEKFYYVNNLINDDKVDYDNKNSIKQIFKGDPEYDNNVIKLDAFLQTTTKMDVFLGNSGTVNSSVSPLELIKDINDSQRGSLFARPGDSISRDGICAAVRVAFYEYMDEYKITLKNSDEQIIHYVTEGATISSNVKDNTTGKNKISFSDGDTLEIEDFDSIILGTKSLEVLKVIWVPNDKYELSYSDGYIEYNLEGSRERLYREFTDPNDERSKNDLPYGYLSLGDSGVNLEAYSVEDYLNGKIIVGNNIANVTSSSVTNGNKPICSFFDSKTPVKKHIGIKIWIEGTDREADKALNGGFMNYQFVFVGMNKSDNLILVSDNTPNEELSILEPGSYKKIIYSSFVEQEQYEDTETEEIKYRYVTVWYLHYDGTNTPCEGLMYSSNGIDWLKYSKGVDLKDKNYYYKLIEDSQNLQSNIIQYHTIQGN